MTTIRANDPALIDWLNVGKSLLARRTETEWALADWLASGREQFGNQAAFDFLGDELGIAPKQLRSAANTAVLFPPSLRASGLTFEHHESVVGLPINDALAVLKKAQNDKLDDRETRVEAVRRKAEIAPSMLPDEDWEQVELMTLTRAWNRARSSVRIEFLELAEEAKGEDIDA
jgi:hypothetical protein